MNKKRIFIISLLYILCLTGCNSNKDTLYTYEPLKGTYIGKDTTNDILTEGTRMTENELSDELLCNIQSLLKRHPDDTMNLDMNVEMDILLDTPNIDEVANMHMSGNGIIQYNNGNTHMKMITTISSNNQIINDEISEFYQIVDNNTITNYEYDAMENNWITYSTDMPSDISNIALSTDQFRSINIEETDTEYIFVGKSDTTKIENGLLDLLELDNQIAEITITIHFDKKTKEYTSILYTISDFYTDSMFMSNIAITINNNGFTNDIINYPGGNIKDE